MIGSRIPRRVRGIIGLHAVMIVGTIRVLADYKDVEEHAHNPDGNDTPRVTIARSVKGDVPPIVITGLALDI